MDNSLPAPVVQALAKRLGFDNLSPASQAALAETFGPTLAAAWFNEAAALLSDEDKARMGEYLEKEDGEGLLAFITERIPDFKERLAAALPKA